MGGRPLRPGLRIAHDRFGLGSILHVEGSGTDARISVRFDDGSTKTLLLKFAKIRVVG